MIQGSINQLLTLAAAGAKFSPGFQKKVQIKELEARAAGIREQRTAKAQTEHGPGGHRLTIGSAQREIEEGLAAEAVDVSRELFQLDPTKERFRDYQVSVGRKYGTMSRNNRLFNRAFSSGDTQRAAGNAAQASLETEQERVRNSRNIGGTPNDNI